MKVFGLIDNRERIYVGDMEDCVVVKHLEGKIYFCRIKNVKSLSKTSFFRNRDFLSLRLKVRFIMNKVSVSGTTKVCLL